MSSACPACAPGLQLCRASAPLGPGPPGSSLLHHVLLLQLLIKQSHRYPAEHMAHATLVVLERTDYLCSELSTVVIIQFL